MGIFGGSKSPSDAAIAERSKREKRRVQIVAEQALLAEEEKKLADLDVVSDREAEFEAEVAAALERDNAPERLAEAHKLVRETKRLLSAVGSFEAALLKEDIDTPEEEREFKEAIEEARKDLEDGRRVQKRFHATRPSNLVLARWLPHWLADLKARQDGLGLGEGSALLAPDGEVVPVAPNPWSNAPISPQLREKKRAEARVQRCAEARREIECAIPDALTSAAGRSGSEYRELASTLKRAQNDAYLAQESIDKQQAKRHGISVTDVMLGRRGVAKTPSEIRDRYPGQAADLEHARDRIKKLEPAVEAAKARLDAAEKALVDALEKLMKGGAA
jgi:hypothetical protein